MKICERCARTFEDDPALCPADGTPLQPADGEMIGERVGRYVIVRRIGRGAAGMVYKAIHPTIESVVAIKILDETREDNPIEYERFVREAQAVNRIGHPNIVKIMDMDTLDDGRPYMIMEYLIGRTLRERMVETPALEPHEAQALIEQLLDTLQAAHNAGFVHRDLKPENLFVTDDGHDGQIKVLDFGVAHLLGDPSSARLTQKGGIVGTPMYLAPEQASRKVGEIGPRTDLYSVGVLLYELYTGASPWDAKGLGEILISHLKEPPIPPRSRRPTLGEALEGVILHCLEKSPEARPSSANALRQAYSAACAQMQDNLVDTLDGEKLPVFEYTGSEFIPDAEWSDESAVTTRYDGPHSVPALPSGPFRPLPRHVIDSEIIEGSLLPGDEHTPRAVGSGPPAATAAAKDAAKGAAPDEADDEADDEAETNPVKTVESWPSARGEPLPRAVLDDLEKAGARRRSGPLAAIRRHPWIGVGIGVGLAIVIVSAFLLGRCFTGDEPAPKSAAKDPGPSVVKLGSDAGAAKASSQRLVILQTKDVVSLDPLAVSGLESINVLSQLFEPLVRVDPQDGRPIPALATFRVKKGATYYFDLRPGVTFHDGTPLNAAAAVRSLERSLASPLARFYIPDITAVRADGPMGVALVTREHRTSLFTRLALWPWAITKQTTDGKLVGTGPYRVAEHLPQRRTVRLVAHAKYHGGTPRIRELLFRGVDRPGAPGSLLAQGDAHIALALTPRDQASLAKLRDVTTLESEAAGTLYLLFNTQKRYLASPRVRRALARAVARTKLVDRFYRRLGGRRARSSTSLNFAGIGFPPLRLKFDPKRARQRLARYPVAKRTLNLYIHSEPRRSVPDPLAVARVLREGFAEAGIQVAPILKPATELAKLVRAGEHDITVLNWSPDYPDPENVYHLLTREGRAAGLNWSHNKDGVLETLVRRARRARRRAERVALWLQVEARVRRQRPWVPLVELARFVARRREVKGVRFQLGGPALLPPLHTAHFAKPADGE